ncbi:MAG: AI-2E family transporter [Bacteroidia bacterium]
MIQEFKEKTPPFYFKATMILLGISLFVAGIYFGSNIFIPLALAGLISILLFPLCQRLEKWGIHRILAIIICIILIFIVLGGIIFLLSTQVIRFTNELPQLLESVSKKFNDIQDHFSRWFNVSPEGQMDWLRKQTENLLASGGSMLQSTLFATTNTFAVLGLLPIYIFFFLFYRDKFKNFVYKVSPNEKHEKAKMIMGKIKNVVQSYIAGLLIVIIILAILNTVGLTIIGIRYALFFGVMAALLTVIPYIGIFIGSALPILMALLTKDSLVYPLAVFILFTVIQFLEGNFITPNVVGSKVSINPFAAILALIIGGAIWGIPGMIISVPMLGMLKVILDNVEELKPYGYLMGTEGSDEHSVSLSGTWRKIKRIFSGSSRNRE